MESCDGKLGLSKPGASEAANIRSRESSEVFRFEPFKITPLFNLIDNDAFEQKFIFEHWVGN